MTVPLETLERAGYTRSQSQHFLESKQFSRCSVVSASIKLQMYSWFEQGQVLGQSDHAQVIVYLFLICIVIIKNEVSVTWVIANESLPSISGHFSLTYPPPPPPPKKKIYLPFFLF